MKNKLDSLFLHGYLLFYDKSIKNMTDENLRFSSPLRGVCLKSEIGLKNFYFYYIVIFGDMWYNSDKLLCV